MEGETTSVGTKASLSRVRPVCLLLGLEIGMKFLGSAVAILFQPGIRKADLVLQARCLIFEEGLCS